MCFPHTFHELPSFRQSPILGELCFSERTDGQLQLTHSLCPQLQGADAVPMDNAIQKNSDLVSMERVCTRSGIHVDNTFERTTVTVGLGVIG